MKKLSADLKRMLAAMAYADAGEMLSGRQKTHLLDAPDRLAKTAPPPAPAPRRQVALSIGTMLPQAVIDYATGICRRLGADLAVLCTNPTRALALLAPHQAAFAAAGIGCQTISLDGNAGTAMRRYLDGNPQVMFVVSSGPEDPAQSMLENPNNLEAPPVPVVIVANS